MTDDEVKDTEAINFSEYFKSTGEKLCSKLNEEQNLRKVAKWLYIFLATPDEVEKCAKMMQLDSSDKCVYCYNIIILNRFDPELQLINNKPIIKNKFKELLSELKKFKYEIILVLEYKKVNDCKIFHSYTKLIASD